MKNEYESENKMQKITVKYESVENDETKVFSIEKKFDSDPTLEQVEDMFDNFVDTFDFESDFEEHDGCVGCPYENCDECDAENGVFYDEAEIYKDTKDDLLILIESILPQNLTVLETGGRELKVINYTQEVKNAIIGYFDTLIEIAND